MKKAVVVAFLLLSSIFSASLPAQAASLDTRFKLCSEGEADLLRLYYALFNRQPDLKGGDYWIHEYRQGASLDSLAYWMVRGPEFASKYQSVTSRGELVDRFYKNILDRKADANGKKYWLGQLEQGLAPHLVVRWMAKSPELVKRYPYPIAPSCPELTPKPVMPVTQTTVLPTTVPPITTAPATYYRNCSDVWAKLGRSIRRSDPGYSSKLDRNNDGIGCESRPR